MKFTSRSTNKSQAAAGSLKAANKTAKNNKPAKQQQQRVTTSLLANAAKMKITTAIANAKTNSNNNNNFCINSGINFNKGYSSSNTITAINMATTMPKIMTANSAAAAAVACPQSTEQTTATANQSSRIATTDPCYAVEQNADKDNDNKQATGMPTKEMAIAEESHKSAAVQPQNTTEHSQLLSQPLHTAEPYSQASSQSHSHLQSHLASSSSLGCSAANIISVVNEASSQTVLRAANNSNSAATTTTAFAVKLSEKEEAAATKTNDSRNRVSDVQNSDKNSKICSDKCSSAISNNNSVSNDIKTITNNTVINSNNNNNNKNCSEKILTSENFNENLQKEQTNLTIPQQQAEAAAAEQQQQVPSETESTIVASNYRDPDNSVIIANFANSQTNNQTSDQTAYPQQHEQQILHNDPNLNLTSLQQASSQHWLTPLETFNSCAYDLSLHHHQQQQQQLAAVHHHQLQQIPTYVGNKTLSLIDKNDFLALQLSQLQSQHHPIFPQQHTANPAADLQQQQHFENEANMRNNFAMYNSYVGSGLNPHEHHLHHHAHHLGGAQITSHTPSNIDEVIQDTLKDECMDEHSAIYYTLTAVPDHQSLKEQFANHSSLQQQIITHDQLLQHHHHNQQQHHHSHQHSNSIIALNNSHPHNNSASSAGGDSPHSGLSHSAGGGGSDAQTLHNFTQLTNASSVQRDIYGDLTPEHTPLSYYAAPLSPMLSHG